MKKQMMLMGVLFLIIVIVSPGFAAYHHEGENDSDNFISVYPEKAGTKLDHCALCHSGGQYEKKPDVWVSLGSCQWCHHSYGYNGAGEIEDTMNAYGVDYKNNGRNAAAISAIENLDSDGDGYTNIVEIEANRYPGDDTDDPSKITAPYRIYTKEQLKALGSHTQFMLMNTSRSGDFYAEYTGVPMEDLLEDAGILPSATNILVYAPDGWSQYHPLEEDPDPELYHVNGNYPDSFYYYDAQADVALNPTDGWCDYSAPSCQGRNHLDAIVNSGGLKMILAYSRDGQNMDPGILNLDNKLDGEGPYRVVPPQKNPNEPDQSSKATNQDVIWPYDYDWDHNAGASSRTVTIIKVEPLPAGTTDIDVLEAGWAFVDQDKIIVYGAIDGMDSNGNGVLDSEEADATKDFDGDGTPDYQETDCARICQANGGEKLFLHTSAGAITNVEALNADDPAVPQAGKPAMDFPFATVKFDITGLAPGQTVTVTMMFPDDIPVTSRYYKIDTSNGWHEIPFGDNDGDSTITLTLTDGDPTTDGDGKQDGTISDPGAVAISPSTSSTPAVDSGGSSGCFIATAAYGSKFEPHVKLLRDFRDKFLLNNALGKAFIRAYYTYSPPIADFISKHDHLRTVVRVSLLPVVGMSWVALKLGISFTTTLMFFFSMGTIGLISFRRKKIKPKLSVSNSDRAT
jgi:hypothetical protein